MGGFKMIRFTMRQVPLVVKALDNEAEALQDTDREYSKSLGWISRTVNSFYDPRESQENTVVGLSLAPDVIETILTQLSSDQSNPARQIKQALKAAIGVSK